MRRAMDVRARISFSSQTASGARSHRRSVSNRCKSPGLKRCDNRGKMQITTIGFRSSRVAQQLARPASSLRLHPVLRSTTTSRSMSNKLPLAAKSPWEKHFCHLRRFTAQLSQTHHLTVCRLDKWALCKVLQTRQPCIFDRSSCSSRCRHFAAPRSCSTAAAALAHDHVPSWRHFTFPSLGFFREVRLQLRRHALHFPLVSCIRRCERLIDCSLWRQQDNLDIPEFHSPSGSRCSF